MLDFENAWLVYVSSLEESGFFIPDEMLYLIRDAFGYGIDIGVSSNIK